MNAILLAAGVGSRTSHFFGDKPKCLANITDGKTLLEYSIDNLLSHGFDQIVIVVGYNKHYILDVVSKYGQKVKLVFNPFYRVTNSLGSIWFVRDYLVGPTLISNADVFVVPDILEIVGRCKETTIFYDSSRKIDADYRFFIQNGKLIEHGKDLSPNKTTGEYVGLCFVSKEDIDPFVQHLNDMVLKEEYNRWWENILYSYCDVFNPCFFDVAGFKWGEIDTIEDYEKVKKMYENK